MSLVTLKNNKRGKVTRVALIRQLLLNLRSYRSFSDFDLDLLLICVHRREYEVPVLLFDRPLDLLMLFFYIITFLVTFLGSWIFIIATINAGYYELAMLLIIG